MFFSTDVPKNRVVFKVRFDVIMANPPYSVKKWNRDKWMNDLYGRNIWGTPPQGCADYAFQQHIMRSLNPETGRCVVLWPHGVLFRDAESDMRKRMIEEDYVDAVIGLGKNLFYNSSMESCLLVCWMKKADKTISDVRLLIENNRLRSAVNRIYYGMFYSLLALAIANQYETTKHARLIRLVQ